MKRFFLVLSILLGMGVIVSGALLTNQVNGSFKRSSNSNNGTTSTNNSPDHGNQVDKSEYILRANATDYQQTIFAELLKAHENYHNTQSDENKKAYAEAVVKNFIADFYTWTNKEGRNDVGGLQFIATAVRSDFRRAAIDNFYLYLNQYIEIHGAETLINVANVLIKDISLTTFALPDHESRGELPSPATEGKIEIVKVEASWEYAPSSLAEIKYFGQKATILLVEDNGHLAIRVIEDLNENELKQVHLE